MHSQVSWRGSAWKLNHLVNHHLYPIQQGQYGQWCVLRKKANKANDASSEKRPISPMMRPQKTGLRWYEDETVTAPFEWFGGTGSGTAEPRRSLQPYFSFFVLASDAAAGLVEPRASHMSSKPVKEITLLNELTFRLIDWESIGAQLSRLHHSSLFNTAG